MTDIDSRITKFIAKHHVMTLATSTATGEPYCCNLFYAYDKRSAGFIFTSDNKTHHTGMFLQNSRVAASIVLETRIVGRVQGLQITGRITEATEADKMLYLKRFPYAVVADLTLWRMEPDMMKLTDNTLGFGKKLIWHRQEL